MPSLNSILFILAASAVSSSLALPSLQIANPLAKRGCGNPTLEGNYGPCFTFCDTHTSVVNGKPLKASADLNCTASECISITANSVTVTESYSVDSGFSIDPITATSDFTWSKSVTSSDSYEFELKTGAVGFIQFTPKMNQICGVETMYEASTGGAYNAPYCTTNVDKVDKNACGQTPNKLSNGNANGEFSFCHEDGTGCDPLTPKNK